MTEPLGRDYFSVDEFVLFAGERLRFPRSEIEAAQTEVVASLEAWARSAWPNVIPRGTGQVSVGSNLLTLTSGTFVPEDVGRLIRVEQAGAQGDLITTVSSVDAPDQVTLADPAGASVADASVWLDGDGTAHGPRVAMEELPIRGGMLFLGRIPVIELLVVSPSGSSPIDPAECVLRPRLGIVELPGQPKGWCAVTYSYGHLRCPRQVRRPAMAATLSLLRDSQPTKIPTTATQVTTESTTFVFGGKPAWRAPWPWDEAASDAVRTWWGPSRPRVIGGA